MRTREGYRRVDVVLGGDLYEAFLPAIQKRGFSLRVRLAAKRLADEVEASPEKVTKRMGRRLSELAKAKQGPLTKRLSVEFSVEELSELDNLTEHFRTQGLKLWRQDVIRLALLDLPNHG